jgi:hypothetical protein
MQPSRTAVGVICGWAGGPVGRWASAGYCWWANSVAFSCQTRPVKSPSRARKGAFPAQARVIQDGECGFWSERAVWPSVRFVGAGHSLHLQASPHSSRRPVGRFKPSVAISWFSWRKLAFVRIRSGDTPWAYAQSPPQQPFCSGLFLLFAYTPPISRLPRSRVGGSRPTYCDRKSFPLTWSKWTRSSTCRMPSSPPTRPCTATTTPDVDVPMSSQKKIRYERRLVSKAARRDGHPSVGKSPARSSVKCDSLMADDELVRTDDEDEIRGSRL